MNPSTGTLLVIAFLAVLAIFVSVISILILSGGTYYDRIPEKSRPRRWFVGIFFSYFLLFCLWFPVRFLYPHTLPGHVLSFLFGAFTMLLVGWVALGRISVILLPIIALVVWIIDAYVDRGTKKR